MAHASAPRGHRRTPSLAEVIALAVVAGVALGLVIVAGVSSTEGLGALVLLGGVATVLVVVTGIRELEHREADQRSDDEAQRRPAASGWPAPSEEDRVGSYAADETVSRR